MSIGSPDWGGVSLLSAESVVIADTFITLAPGAHTTIKTAVIRPSYRIRAFFQNVTDTITITPVQIDMEWDSLLSGGFVTDRQRWNLFAGDSSAPHYILGKGPCAGNQLTITITNKAAATAHLNMELYITETAQYFTYHDWRTDDFTSVKFPGMLQVESDVRAGLICILDHITVAAAATVLYAVPLFCGPTTMQWNISSAGGDNQFWVLNGSDAAFANNAFYYTEAPIAEGPYTPPVFLPRTQTTLQIANYKATVADTLSVSIIAGPVP